MTTKMENKFISDYTSVVLEDQFNYIYGCEVLNHILKLSKSDCYGCMIGHLSQTKHSCVTLSSYQKLQRYFYTVIKQLDDYDVLIKWDTTVCSMNIDPSELTLYRSKMFCNSWRQEHFKTNLWKKKLYKNINRMLKLQERLT